MYVVSNVLYFKLLFNMSLFLLLLLQNSLFVTNGRHQRTLTKFECSQSNTKQFRLTKSPSWAFGFRLMSMNPCIHTSVVRFANPVSAWIEWFMAISLCYHWWLYKILICSITFKLNSRQTGFLSFYLTTPNVFCFSYSVKFLCEPQKVLDLTNFLFLFKGT